jgi:hypothetical protein
LFYKVCVFLLFTLFASLEQVTITLIQVDDNNSLITSYLGATTTCLFSSRATVFEIQDKKYSIAEYLNVTQVDFCESDEVLLLFFIIPFRPFQFPRVLSIFP